MSEGDTTRTIRRLDRWGGVALRLVVFPLGLGLAGFSLYLLSHRVLHQHPEPPYWLMLTLLGLGISPLLYYFRAQFFGVVDAGLKRAPIIGNLRKPKGGE